MSRLEEIKNELAVKVFPGHEYIKDYQTFSDYFASRHPDWFTNLHREVAEIYARECMANALQLASFSANMKYHDGRTKEDSEIKYFQNGADNLIVNRESITNPDNIVLL